MLYHCDHYVDLPELPYPIGETQQRRFFVGYSVGKSFRRLQYFDDLDSAFEYVKRNKPLTHISTYRVYQETINVAMITDKNHRP